MEVWSMKIATMSIELLQELYCEFNETSKSLLVYFNPLDFAKRLGISHQNVFICLWYLKSKDYIVDHDIFNSNADETTTIKVVLTAKAIDLIEHVI